MGKTVLAGIYLLIWKVWIFLYTYRVIPQKRVSCFVVSVGNLTVGGTGKTPFTLFLARQYQERGKRVGIVSRGYRGNYKAPVTVVSDGQTIFESAQVAGDEPYFMAKRLEECRTAGGDRTWGNVPIVVSKDRFLGCQWLIDHFKVDLILLDDGFQHLRLHRDLNILLIDTTEKNRSLLPKGPMREPFSAIDRADVVVLTRLKQDAEPFHLPHAFGGPILKTFFVPVELIHLKNGARRSPSDLSGETILAFCGIGNPNAFIKMLTQLGAKICKTVLFPDHFKYTASDIKKIGETSCGLGIKSIVTTEKDAVKIEKLLDLPIDIWVLRIEIAFFDPPNVWGSPFF